MLVVARCTTKLDPARGTVLPAQDFDEKLSRIRPCSSSSRSGGSTWAPKLNKTSTTGPIPRSSSSRRSPRRKQQHRRLKEQAANVIASQKQSRDAAQRQDGRAREAQRQRPSGADDGGRCQKAGDATKAAQYNSAAETIANQLIQVEKDVEGLKTMVIESTQAVRSGQGCGRTEQPPPAAEAGREEQAPLASSSRRRCRRR